MKYAEFKKNALTCSCRRCINEKYGLKLRQTDCCYWHYPEPCSVCGQVRNIVMDIRPVGRRKLWFK